LPQTAVRDATFPNDIKDVWGRLKHCGRWDPVTKKLIH